MSVIEYLRIIKYRISERFELRRDYREYERFFACSRINNKNGKKSAREIIVLSHVVEKGLSHKNLKPLFGFDKITILEKSIEDYIKKGGNDEFIINLGISTLKKYNLVNYELGVQKEKLVKIPPIEYSEKIDVGVNSISKEEVFSCHNRSFSEMCSNRRSIRLYDCKSEPIDLDVIKQCVKIAQNSPNACNRQAVRISVITDENNIESIIEIQGGAKGFGNNAGAIIVVTSDISLYNPSERRIPMLDCGLFIMSFVYALQEKKIGSCILNASFTEKQERKIRKIVPIPHNEMYSAIIALFNIPDGEQVYVANSAKRKDDDIIRYIE